MSAPPPPAGLFNSAAPRSAYPAWLAAEIASGAALLWKSCRTAAEARSREAGSWACALAGLGDDRVQVVGLDETAVSRSRDVEFQWHWEAQRRRHKAREALFPRRAPMG
jgi:hypothetical protein